MSARFDQRLLARRFGRAAKDYSRIAVLQREVESRLLERLDQVTKPPGVVLDVGAGPGRAAGDMRRRFRGAQVIALDLAPAMLALARRQGGLWRPLPVICADASALPLADASVDLLFSSLCLQWATDLPATLAEFRRVLRPGALLLLSIFGPDTLHELRSSWAQADERAHVSDFPDISVLGDTLLHQGFRDPVLDRETFTLSYASLDELLAELRGIGANNARGDRSRGLSGKNAWQRMRAGYAQLRDDEGRYPASYEVIYAQAFAPDPGAPRRVAGAEIATIPVSAIGRLRKDRSG